jgi:hypothetical protein
MWLLYYIALLGNYAWLAGRNKERMRPDEEILRLFNVYPTDWWRISEIRGRVSFKNNKIRYTLKDLTEKGILEHQRFDRTSFWRLRCTTNADARKTGGQAV